MVKSPIKFKKSKFLRQKYKSFKLNPATLKKSSRGRPKKLTLPTSFTFTLKKLFKRASIIQTMDLFPEIPILLLKEIARIPEKEEQKKKHDLWICERPNYERTNEAIYFEKNYKDINKQLFSDFMTIVITRTNISLGLQNDASELLLEIQKCFCHDYQLIEKQKVKDSIWEKMVKNELYKKRVEKFFSSDRKFFDQIIEIFFKCRKTFLREFVGDLVNNNA